jgi:hypothetical protein
MSASLDVKSHGWKLRFKVILIASTFEGMDTIVFTKYGVCLDDPARRLVFSMSVSAQMTVDQILKLSLTVSAGHRCIIIQHMRTVRAYVSRASATFSFLVGGVETGGDRFCMPPISHRNC